MELEIVRRIRGNVHGTVDVSALEDRVLAHPSVQRLRRIKQLAFLSYVFPGATHTRFEHSLGVMQLAGVAWTKMRANQQRLATTCLRYRDFGATESRGVDGLVHGLLAPTFGVIDDIFDSNYALQCLRLAGFLHDLGHPPFSHSGERFLPSWDEVLKVAADAPSYLLTYLRMRRELIAANGRDPSTMPVRHEIYTLLLIEQVLKDIYSTQPASRCEVRVAPRDVLAILAPEIGPEPGSPLAKHGLYRLCHELISGEVDIDRMDYLLRDSRECGVVYGIFDATRIQDSLTFYHDPQDGGLHLAISFSGLAAFEDYLRARQSMYLQLYFHKTSVACEAMLQHLVHMLGDWRLPASLAEYADLDEYNIEAALEAAGRARIAPGEQERYRRLVFDLLRGRKLWKRVFEVAGKEGAISRRGVDRAERVITEMGIPYERLSSSNSLTTFRPRGEGEASRNYLRLIKKDEYQFPRVVPIEDYTQIVAANHKVHINRIYVPDELNEIGESLPAKVKQTLTDMALHDTNLA